MEDYWNYSNYFCHHMKNPNLAWIWISNKSYVKIFKKHFFTNIIGHGQKEHKKTHGIRLKKSLNKRNQFHRSFFFSTFSHFLKLEFQFLLKIFFFGWNWFISFHEIFFARSFKNSLAGNIPGLVTLGHKFFFGQNF